jgi:hypothetical protein
MGCLGVHFSIDAAQAERLLGAADDDELLELVEEIEEEWADAFETDKAWDALHRCLSDGTLTGEGKVPLDRVFFGGRTLNESDDYFVVLVTPAEVREIADALAKVDAAWLRGRYFELPFPDYQGEKSDEDWEYTLANFDGLPEFFARAAAAGRHALFTVSQ